MSSKNRTATITNISRAGKRTDKLDKQKINGIAMTERTARIALAGMPLVTPPLHVITDHRLGTCEWIDVLVPSVCDERCRNEYSVGTKCPFHTRGSGARLLTRFEASFWASGSCVKPESSQARLVRVFC